MIHSVGNRASINQGEPVINLRAYWAALVIGLVIVSERAFAAESTLATEARKRGASFFEKGDFDNAIADCTEAIRLDPKDALAYLNRGLAYRSKGDSDKAIADFKEAIRLASPQ
jgi:tetratricopeptide (TPR) repeat protein